MLQITPQHHIHIAIKPVDFRKGINGLKAYCEKSLYADPFSGHIFVFCNRQRSAVKLLVYDGNGFWYCHKRFSYGQLAWWPKSTLPVEPLSSAQLQIVLQQGDPMAAELPPTWLPVNSNQDGLVLPGKSKATMQKAQLEPSAYEYV